MYVCLIVKDIKAPYMRKKHEGFRISVHINKIIENHKFSIVNLFLYFLCVGIWSIKQQKGFALKKNLRKKLTRNSFSRFYGLKGVGLKSIRNYCLSLFLLYYWNRGFLRQQNSHCENNFQANWHWWWDLVFVDWSLLSSQFKAFAVGILKQFLADFCCVRKVLIVFFYRNWQLRSFFKLF